MLKAKIHEEMKRK